MIRSSSTTTSNLSTSATSQDVSVDSNLVRSNSSMRLYVFALVFLCGASSIGTELAMSRLLAPYFGTSTFIWANLIGLTLAFLAIGYVVGGRIADRDPSLATMSIIAGLAGLSVIVIPVIARPILRVSLDAFDDRDVGAFFGSFFGTLLLLAAPMILFGCISPFAIRMRTQNIRSSGETAGNIYALSTVGSIVGSFLPVLVLIPLFGTRMTFLILGALLVVASAVGLVLARAMRPASILVLLGFLAAGILTATANAEIKPPYRGDLVYETESEYNYIQVLEEDGRLLLALNDGHAIHSIYDPNSVLTGGPWDYVLLGPTMSGIEPQRALIVGLAGGTSARSLLDTYPGLHIDGVEIDPEVLSVARRWFALPTAGVTAYALDGRYFLERMDAVYDLVVLDAYRQPYIPFHLATKEFFETVDEHLTADGVVVVNVGRSTTDYRLVDALSSTLASVFDSVWLVDVAGYDNTMVFATNQPLELETIEGRLASVPPESNQGQVAFEVLDQGNLRMNRASRTPYTDDRAPVESLIDRMIFDAAREETSE